MFKNNLLSYIICTFPAVIFTLNDKTNFLFPSSNLAEWCYAASYILVVLPFATNPLIYVVSNQNYRRCAVVWVGGGGGRYVSSLANTM